jgi:hypothetical protein
VYGRHFVESTINNVLHFHNLFFVMWQLWPFEVSLVFVFLFTLLHLAEVTAAPADAIWYN